MNYILRLGIQHPFELHITLLTKLIVDVVTRRFQGPSPVLRGSTNKVSAVYSRLRKLKFHREIFNFMVHENGCSPRTLSQLIIPVYQFYFFKVCQVEPISQGHSRMAPALSFLVLYRWRLSNFLIKMRPLSTDGAILILAFDIVVFFQNCSLWSLPI